MTPYLWYLMAYYLLFTNEPLPVVPDGLLSIVSPYPWYLMAYYILYSVPLPVVPDGLYYL